MNDTIYRQAAIDAMTTTLFHYPIECLRNINKYEFAKGLAELGLKSIPSAQPEWIPCSERLPKEDGQYLITEKGTFGDYLYIGIANYGVPMMPMNKGQGRGWFITDSEGEYYCGMNHVLAWMPLPEPWKGKRE